MVYMEENVNKSKKKENFFKTDIYQNVIFKYNIDRRSN